MRAWTFLHEVGCREEADSTVGVEPEFQFLLNSPDVVQRKSRPRRAFSKAGERL